MPKPSLQNYLHQNWGDNKVRAFSIDICPKVNVLLQLEFDLAYYDVAV